MLKELKLPESGMGITEGTINRWLKSPGDVIAKNEVLAEVETAKAVVEVSSPIDGVLEKTLVQAGATAEVGATIALIRQESGAVKCHA